MAITLKQLRYADALARQGHFGRAAELCSISQPALSAQIKDLERALGTLLFERVPSGARLTGFGAEFLERARHVLAQVEELGDMARAAQGTLSGPLRLGVIPTIAPYLLPALLPRLNAGFPGAELRIRESQTARLVAELSEGSLDAAIVALPVGETGFEEVPLFSEGLVLVRPRAQADLPVPDRAALAQERLLLLEEGHCFRDHALSFCALDRSAAARSLDSRSLSTLVQMVGAGLGVTFIPEMAVAVETRSADVAVAAFEAPTPAREVGMIWRKSSVISEQLRQVAQVVSQAAQG
jgi:LysR family hydrogen peroxide-inducible transcriptional activator